MQLIETLTKLLEKNLCNHCLGRFYSSLLYKLSNEERGKTLKAIMALAIDAKLIDYSKVNLNNFYEFKFKQNKDLPLIKKESCYLCDNLFENIDSFVKKAIKKLEKIQFNNFLVGSRISNEILEKEEKLWEITGINYVESIKSEVNREIGKKIKEIVKKPINYKNPEVVILADFEKNDVEIQINSLYILGYYKKFARGIPQCKWGTPGKYKTSVQEIVAKPIMKITKGKNNFFHGYGREDINARCLDWRPFVIEITHPKIRNFNLKNVEKQINKSKKIKVKLLKVVDKFTVKRIKSEAGDKTYKVIVKLNKKVEKNDLEKLKNLIGVIQQRTPLRVAHRRADLIRKRIVKSIKYKQINKKTIELVIKTNAGLYVKELVTGDNGRTKPSVSDLLNVKAKPINLDVIKIEKPKNL
ncbi:MAG: tRNA pseudouridine(54/55) synthase Pus10 [Candidatus Aenigmatarchaeota archaeon]